MKKTLFLLAFAAVAALWTAANAQTVVDVTVNPDKPLSRIDNKIYGHFLEHIYNSCNGGLWGELVWNRSFEAGAGANWQYDKGSWTFVESAVFKPDGILYFYQDEEEIEVDEEGRWGSTFADTYEQTAFDKATGWSRWIKANKQRPATMSVFTEGYNANEPRKKPRFN